MTYQKSITQKQALIAAVHAVKPPVLMDGVIVDMKTPHRLETVTVTYAMTPELVKAWGDECARPGVEMAEDLQRLKDGA